MTDRVTDGGGSRGGLGNGRPAATTTCVLLAALLTGWCWSPSAAAGQKQKRGRRTAAEKSKAATAESSRPAEEEKSRAKNNGKRAPRSRAGRAGSRCLAAEYLRYLPDGCNALGWIDVDGLRQSSGVKRMKLDVSDAVEQWEEIEAITGRPLAALERIVIGLAYSSRWECTAVGVFRFKAPVGENHDPAPGASWHKETVGRFDLFVKDDSQPWAICDVDADTMLAGDVETVRAILKRDAPLKLPEKLAAAYSLLEPTSDIAVAILPVNMAYDAVMFQVSLGIPAETLRGIEAVTLEFGLDDDLDVRLAAVCRDNETASQLKGIATGLWARIDASNFDDADAVTREIVDSVRFPVEGRSVALELSVPPAYLEEVGNNGDRLLSSLKRDGPFGIPILGTNTTASTTQDGTQATASCAPSEEPALTPVAPAPSAPSCYSASRPPGPAAPPGGTYSSAPNAGYRYSNPGYGYSSAAPYGSRYSGTISPQTSGPPGYRPRPTLKVEDVIRLAEAEVDEQVILAFVQKRRLSAPLTADDLVLLKEKGVSTRVILALQDLPLAPPEYRAAPVGKTSESSSDAANIDTSKSAAMDLPPDIPPLAVGGYCPVAMVDRRSLVPGEARWGAIHRGKTYLFSDAHAQQKFLVQPDHYASVAARNWNPAGNQEIARQIADNLRRSGQLSDYEIGVKFQDGTAWLRGRARSQEQVLAAGTIARETPGVIRVVNDVIVGDGLRPDESGPPTGWPSVRARSSP